MKLLAIFLATFASVAISHADDFVGIFLQGQRIGYIHSVLSTTPDGKTNALVTTNLGAKILGQGMSLKITSTSVRKGAKLEAQTFRIDSAGRIQDVSVKYSDAKVQVERTSGTSVEKKSLDIPLGAIVLDDPTIGLVGKDAPEPGTKLTFYVFDPTTLTLIKNEAEYLGKAPFSGAGVKGEGFKIKVVDPRATTEIWIDDKGNMLFGTGPLGMMLRPITRAEAVGSEGYFPEVDIASASRLVPDKPIETPHTVKKLKLSVEGAALPRLRSDYFQSVERNEDGTITLTIHPKPLPAQSATIALARKEKPEFVKASLNIPAGDTEMKKLAGEILAGETNSVLAAQKISLAVYKLMKPNASIGVLRDAKEILATKEGVCRDYATLATTLMRAAGIPTKIVTGAVYSGDGFYYHAWVEIFDGANWLAFDPTMGGGWANATHIKFAEGNVEEAFVTFTLDGTKVKVLEVAR